MARGFFEGYYFKHQKGRETVAFIPGRASSGAFIQVITNEKSFSMAFDVISMGSTIQIGGCTFSKDGIQLNNERLKGSIQYADITPIEYDIMGPFKIFPMQCRHGVISMFHTLSGSIEIDDVPYNFDGGRGYIEKDSGRSFPKRYVWIHCNDFEEKCSIMAAIADIPFLGIHFMGCICAVVHGQKEYRFATYLGVKIQHCSKNGITLVQGKNRLEIEVAKNSAHALYAPTKGQMTNMIHESNNSAAQFKLYVDDKLVFHKASYNVSYEYNM